MEFTIETVRSTGEHGDDRLTVCVIRGPLRLEEGQTLVLPFVNPHMPISKRQLDVVRHLSEGMVYKQIATEMNIAISTVRTHLHNIYLILGVSDRAQAVLKCKDEGWL